MEDLQIQKIGNVLQIMDRMCQNPNFLQTSGVTYEYCIYAR